jgi:hypothetical protein
LNGVEVKRIALIAMTCALASGASAQENRGDFSYSPVSTGAWGYREIAGGSEASFVDGAGTTRMVIACGKITRLVTLSRVSAAPAASLSFWTSSSSRSLSARFDQPSGRVIAQLGGTDPLLDALAFSRGRFAAMMPGSPALVLPAGPEVAHVVEDCRAT